MDELLFVIYFLAVTELLALSAAETRPKAIASWMASRLKMMVLNQAGGLEE